MVRYPAEMSEGFPLGVPLSIYVKSQKTPRTSESSHKSWMSPSERLMNQL